MSDIIVWATLLLLIVAVYLMWDCRRLLKEIKAQLDNPTIKLYSGVELPTSASEYQPQQVRALSQALALHGKFFHRDGK